MFYDDRHLRCHRHLPVENLYRAGDPKDYYAALPELVRDPRKGVTSP